MRKSLLNRHKNGLFHTGFLWLNSHHIAPALDDSLADSQRITLQHPGQWELLTEAELVNYHRQLFMWRIQTILPAHSKTYTEFREKETREA